ncbi:TMEM175 family protein [Companilactobacillus nuruki]|uniref:DUF1211 domain-containing protein n=1 Tax=Companilactobacillus nuruki TaxID=1993540 RepID=A0A2N7AR19_9LACO|nr:TMEM175 family protein [Companilactobacillus nuruki]PMD67797.1 hypothetical protein CBP76_12785 [Companilactobacillus nuruki]
MKKIKERFDAFTDAILAIIITIIVLELPIEVVNNQVNYRSLFSAIGIYAVSFCFVANVWFEHTTIFNELNEVNNQVMVQDIFMIFLVSLLPTFTKLMINDTNKQTVTLYGLLYLIITVTIRGIAKSVIHQKYHDKDEMAKVYIYIYGQHNWENGALIILIIILGIFYPKMSSILFITVPVRSFISNVGKDQAAEGMENLSLQGQSGFMKLSISQRREFIRFVRKYVAESQQHPNKETWEEFLSEGSKKFGMNREELATWFSQNGKQFYRHRKAKR